MNTVLEGLAKIERTNFNQVNYDNIKGQALMLRGKSFLQGAIIWAKVYDERTAATDPGIPLRVTTDFNEVAVRSTVKETFDLLLEDLKNSARLLPVKPVHVRRCSKPAAYGYLSRAYLYMQNYVAAGKYADSCLQLQNILLDYNLLNAAASYPVPKFNEEEILYSTTSPVQLVNSLINVDSNLYKSYEINDLRKQIFFQSKGNGAYRFKGSYDGNFGGKYTGIAADEVYLARAECFARSGNTQQALDDLNTLMIKRWKAGSFIPFSANGAAEALTIILRERRKELIFRSIRFMDIKRLNKEGAGISITRMVDSQHYTLAPDDKRYALPIPEDIIILSGMAQNPR